jgi:hypothetical protein
VIRLKKTPKAPSIPEPSRFDRLDEETLYLLVEQALGTAQAQFDSFRTSNAVSAPAMLDYCDTALSDAQAGIRSLLRRRVVLLQNR